MKSDNGTVELIVRAQQAFKGQLIGLGRFIARSTFPSTFPFEIPWPRRLKDIKILKRKRKQKILAPFPLFLCLLSESLDSFLAPSSIDRKSF